MMDSTDDAGEPWFKETLDLDEAALCARGVPDCVWGYISANGAPGTDAHDGLGAIFESRADLEDSMKRSSPDMGVAVVDGRDTEVIRQWIGGRDWTADVEQRWLKKVQTRERLQASYKLLQTALALSGAHHEAQ